MEPVEISAPGLLLRPWRATDAPEVMLALREAAIAQWNPLPGVVDLEAARAWVRRRADWSSLEHVSLAIANPTTDALLGSLSLHQICGENAAIGYWTVEQARGRGVASRAVTAMTDWAFQFLRLHRIELCHAVANAASCRVAEKAGYRFEGVLRESHRYGDGQRHDEHIHGRLATDA
ncbi:GNAT family N-acetyltransferase [Micromonospora sonneratiae]|uniref:GNAT family N-acetyltransferase n=1 Tax=Micromonospora sonneratiae TaxID=1184706 RepID=UPI00367146C0